MAPASPPVDLSGRTVLVTGASAGFGAELAKMFWQRGASLFMVGRDEGRLHAVAAHLDPRSGQRASTCAADLATAAGTEALLDHLAHLALAVDVLVNNAAEQGPIGPAVTNDPAQWARTIAVNLLAPVRLCQVVAREMMARGARGKIINLSGGGATGSRQNFSAYAASKAALVRFTEVLADELAAYGIDVNAVAPGAMPTRMTDAVLAAGSAAGQKELDGARRSQARGASVMAAAAELCAFLASPASDGITGRLLSAQWDPWSELPSHKADLDGSDIYTLRRIVPKDRGMSWGER